MAKSTDITATFPLTVTNFGTVTSYRLTYTGKQVLGHDADGEVDAEAYTERKVELEIEGETDGTGPAVGDTFTFDAKTYVVDEVEEGQSNDAVGTFSIKAHYWHNLG